MIKPDKRDTFLNRMNPTHRKWLYGAVVGGSVLAACYALTSDVKPKDKTNEIKNVLTDKKTDDLGIESLLAQIKISNDNFHKLDQRLDKLSKENQLTRDEYQKNMTALNKVNTLERAVNTSTKTFETQIKALSDRITALTNDNTKLQKEVSGMVDDNKKGTAAATDRKVNIQKQEEERIDLNDPYKLYANAPTPNPETSLGEGDSGIAPVLQTSVITEDLSKKPKKKEPKEPEIYIPAGSMLRGVLLAGLDAPTGTNAKKDTFPVNVRIQKDAILPNGYSADVKECFMLMDGYGSLSDERAHLRAQTLSCIKEDGAIIEAKTEGYASGEDGKAGIRGRLVSKTGSLIAKTMMAGFASGISSAFDVRMTPTINTSSDGTVTYEKVYNTEALRGAGAKGVSKAFDKLSDYYMKMADQMFPIIEIDGGRDINIILTNGTKLVTVRDANGNAVGPGMLDEGLDMVPPSPEDNNPPSAVEG
ncbi:TraB/VirB10 family protein [Succinivibrio dextrinosolvens]|uniref:TraB/VirB10 family protein n=1 Tax=Succinivibrio dextrinosolvens TaxID=83771 RepID=UPI00241F35FF|nr:TrbI/VirB10 family protein [Succinivibrio dextrinosolvens]MBE6423088.1 hypothetical protein [Succinivibrio dextrinosolvens]